MHVICMWIHWSCGNSVLRFAVFFWHACDLHVDSLELWQLCAAFCSVLLACM